MSRFEQKKLKQDLGQFLPNGGYSLGHSDQIEYAYKAGEGLSERVVRELSGQKGEPFWMLDRRLRALSVYRQMGIPKWGGNISEIDFNKIHYYLKPAAGL